MNVNWLRVFRIKEVVPGVSAILIAALDTGKVLDPFRLILLISGFLLIFFSAFLINELVDSFDVDKHNPERGKAITKHGVPRNFTLIAFILTSLLGVGILVGINLAWVGILTFLILFVYSAPPLRLKSWPFLELAAVTIGCALLGYISYYLLIGQAFGWREILILLFFSAGFPAIQLVNEAADFWADKKANIKTTAVFLGERRNLELIEGLSFFCVVLGLTSIIVTGHWWYFYLIAIIFFLFTAARFGLTIANDRDRLHELMRTGEKFGVLASDLGTIIMLVIFLCFYVIKMV